MYKYASGQIRFEDFGQPAGMRMDPENRWIRRAESIPWDGIEHRYAELFKNRKGNVAKPLHLALLPPDRTFLDYPCCKKCKIGGFCSGGCALSALVNFNKQCNLEKNNFHFFVDKIFIPQIQEKLINYKGLSYEK
jgi:radical SAM protein with 4Fe4S-binding SPASM domain